MMRSLAHASRRQAEVAPVGRATVAAVRHRADMLQRSLGNQAVQQLAEMDALMTGRPMNPARPSAFAGTGLGVQRKLAVGAVDDPAEREADRIADRMMRMPDGQAKASPADSALRRKCAACEGEERGKLQGKHDRSAGSGSDGAASAAPPIVDEVLRSPGRLLDQATRDFMEPRLGCDFNQVRVHTDARAIESARAMNALAYTVGSDIVFGAGQYAPTAAAGRNLLAHELIHTVQQRAVPVLEADSLAAFGPEGAQECEAGTGAPANGRLQVHTVGPTLARQAATVQPVQFDLESCPDEWKEKIRTASEQARKWVNVALGRIGTMLKNPAANDLTDQYTSILLKNHFKIGTGVQDKTIFDQVTKVYQGFQTINAAFGKPLPITCETTSDKDRLGFVPWSGTPFPFHLLRGLANIHLYKPWFGSSSSIQTQTIIHEMAHRFADKKDIAYENVKKGEYSEKDYGDLSTNEAIDTADCYSAFAREINYI